MHACVKKYRDLYTTELIERMGLEQRNLPDGLAIPALLNPLLGPMQVIVHTGLMNQTQYDRARRKLLRKMQDILDRKDPPLQDTGYKSYDSEIGEISRCIKNTNHQKAEDELTLFEGFKRKKYRPEFDEKKCKVISQEAEVEDPMTGKTVTKTFQICYGPIKKRGKDLPSGKNLADYIDGLGRFSMLNFMYDHSKFIPTLFIQGQCEESRRIVEVGCERFFNLSGYVSSPKRTSLGVRNYERLAMLLCLL